MKKLLFLLAILLHQQMIYGQQRKRLPTPVNLPDHIEYAPSISADGRTLIFQSSRYGLYVNGGNRVPVINAEGRLEKTVQGEAVDFPGVFETRLHSSGEWSKPEPIMSINSYGSGMTPVIGGPSISYDGNMLFFFANYNDPKEGYGREDIYYCTRAKQGWSTPVNLGPEINSAGYEGFPSISPDGKQLYFVKDNLVKKAGGIEKCYRIMRSDIGPDGKWKRPIELPPPVNLDCEKAPRIMADGRTLVFSSIKKGGKGDFDLYYARFQTDGSWSEAVPLDAINTKRSDQSVAISPCGDLFYYVSDGDIFTYITQEELRPFKMATIQGFVTDSITGNPLKTRVMLTEPSGGKVISSIESSSVDGRYTLLAPVNAEYVISVNERNFRQKKMKVTSQDYNDCKLITRNFRLDAVNASSSALRSDIAVLTNPETAATEKHVIGTTEIIVNPDITKANVEKLTAEKEAVQQEGVQVIADSSKFVIAQKPESAAPAIASTLLNLTILLRSAETDAVVSNAGLTISLVDPIREIRWDFDSTKNAYQASVSQGNAVMISAASKGFQPAVLKLEDIRENKRIVIKLLEIKPSVIKIAVKDFKSAAPLPSSLTIVNLIDHQSETMELTNGLLEKIFAEPTELELTAFAKDFTTVSKKIKIEIAPEGKIYEFDVKLDRIIHLLSLKVVDNESGRQVPQAKIDLKNLNDNTTLTMTADAAEKNEVQIAGKGNYEIMCIADGYSIHKSVINIDKERNEIVLKISRVPKPEKYIAISTTDKYSGEKLSSEITYAGKIQKDANLSFNDNDNVLYIKVQGYSDIRHTISQSEIAAGVINFDMEKQVYDFNFQAVSQASRRPITSARFTITDADSKEKITGRVLDGQANIRLSPTKKYVIQVVADGFENLATSFDAVQALYDHNSSRQLLLKPLAVHAIAAETVKPIETAAFGELKKGKSITLNNIIFDQSSPVLRTESFIELDKLAAVLSQNIDMRIEIRGHTDNTGNFDANVRLSKERCESVVNYLIEKGISRSRLEFIGRGPLDPVAPNTTEENKKKNRRVEFTVL